MDQDIPVDQQILKHDTSVTPPTQAASKYPWKQIGLGLILVFLVALGAFVMGRKTVSTSLKQPEPKNLSLPKASTTSYEPLPTQSLPTSGYKTLLNVNHYAIEYPPNFDIRGQGAGSPEDVDITKEDAITILTDKDLDGSKNPHMQIVALIPFPQESLYEVAQKNFKENTENKSASNEIIESLHEDLFKGKKAYTYVFRCNGFQGISVGFWGIPGTCRMIFTENNEKYFFIGYYDIPAFKAIAASFSFTE